MSTKFITSNRDKTGLWHVGIRRELRGEKTGKLFHVYYVTKCSGKQLGGVWGQTEVEDLSDWPNADKCPRCFGSHKEVA